MRKAKWTKEMDRKVRLMYPTAHLGLLAAVLGVSACAVKARAARLGVRRKVHSWSVWTERQLKYLERHYADTAMDVLMKKTGHSANGVWNKANELGLRKDRAFWEASGKRVSQHPKSVAARFAKGCKPWNMGRKMEEYVSEDGMARSTATRFRKGQRPHNARAVGDERLHDGYVWVKVEKGWKPKHRLLWERAHGSIPKGYVVAFKDGDKTHCELDNLCLLSRGEHMRRNCEETEEKRRERIAKAQASRNVGIRRDKVRIHHGLEPLGQLVKRW